MPDELQPAGELRLGAAIKQLRGLRGLTQRQLAKRAGCSQQLITFIETGQRAPSWDTLILFAEALECRLSVLIAAAEEELVDKTTLERVQTLEQRLDTVGERVCKLERLDV